METVYYCSFMYQLHNFGKTGNLVCKNIFPASVALSKCDVEQGAGWDSWSMAGARGLGRFKEGWFIPNARGTISKLKPLGI